MQSNTQKNWNKTFKNKKVIDLKPLYIPLFVFITVFFLLIMWGIYIA